MLRHPTDDQSRLIMRAHSQKISYWLLPESPQFTAFQSSIDKLARRFGGPSFEPHVTVYAGSIDPHESPADLVRQAFAGVRSLVLRSRGVEFSDMFTKSCYLQFDPSEKLHALCELLRSGSSIAGDYALNPHLSLFYGRLDRDSRTQLQTLVDIPVEIRFTTVWVVSTPDPVTRQEDVEQWRLVHARELARLAD